MLAAWCIIKDKLQEPLLTDRFLMNMENCTEPKGRCNLCSCGNITSSALSAKTFTSVCQPGDWNSKYLPVPEKILCACDHCTHHHHMASAIATSSADTVIFLWTSLNFSSGYSAKVSMGKYVLKMSLRHLPWKALCWLIPNPDEWSHLPTTFFLCSPKVEWVTKYFSGSVGVKLL